MKVLSNPSKYKYEGAQIQIYKGAPQAAAAPLPSQLPPTPALLPPAPPIKSIFFSIPLNFGITILSRESSKNFRHHPLNAYV